MGQQIRVRDANTPSNFMGLERRGGGQGVTQISSNSQQKWHSRALRKIPNIVRTHNWGMERICPLSNQSSHLHHHRWGLEVPTARVETDLGAGPVCHVFVSLSDAPRNSEHFERAHAVGGGGGAGLYAHRHHTHPLTTGALQNGQNGQNGAKRCKTGAKRCKTVQNGAKWVQNGCKMGANRLNGQKRRWGNGGRMVGLWWMTTLTSLPEDCMHIATPWTSFPLSMRLL